MKVTYATEFVISQCNKLLKEHQTINKKLVDLSSCSLFGEIDQEEEKDILDRISILENLREHLLKTRASATLFPTLAKHEDLVSITESFKVFTDNTYEKYPVLKTK